jgi:hypothetical protein
MGPGYRRLDLPFSVETPKDSQEEYRPAARSCLSRHRGDPEDLQCALSLAFQAVHRPLLVLRRMGTPSVVLPEETAVLEL